MGWNISHLRCLGQSIENELVCAITRAPRRLSPKQTIHHKIQGQVIVYNALRHHVHGASFSSFLLLVYLVWGPFRVNGVPACAFVVCAHANKSVAIIHLGVFIIMSAAVWALGENVFGSAAGAGARPLASAANVYFTISRQPLPHHRKSCSSTQPPRLIMLYGWDAAAHAPGLKNTNQNQYKCICLRPADALENYNEEKQEMRLYFVQ